MKITIQKNTLNIDGVQVFLYSGEIHYFRIPFDEWEDRILKAKEAGLNCISSYIPWIWHEPEEGDYDFNGRTLKERNLLHFIDLVNKHGLYFIARVGPYFNAELIYDGLPQWLVKSGKIKPLSNEIPHMFSYHDPVFLNYVKKWYENLLPHIAQRQITRGGNIILVQLCNEIGVLNWLNKQPDLTEYGEAIFKEYAKDILTSQSELLKPVDKLSQDFFNGIQVMKFYPSYFASYFKILKNFARSLGIEVPFVANVAQFEDFHDRGRAFDAITTAIMFDELSKDDDVILAGDFYPKRIDYDNFHDTVIAIEILKSVSEDKPVMCMELQAGFIYDRPKIYPSDVELLTNTCIGHGLCGVNFYMFSGGTNYENVGVYGKWHDWQSPISWDGKLRESYYRIKEISKYVNEFEISGLEKVYDAYVGIYKPYFLTMFLNGGFVNEIVKTRNLYFHDGVLRLLSTLNVNFKFVDIEKEELSELDHLLILSFDWMDEITQLKLAEFLKRKTLVVFYDLPTKNLKGFNTQILTDILGIERIEKSSEEHYKFVSIFNEEIPVFSQITKVELNGDFNGIAKFKDQIVGFVKNVENGKVIFVGFGINQRYIYQLEIMRKILEIAGIKPKVQCVPEDVHASLLRKGDRYYLFVANYHEEEREVQITVNINTQKVVNLKIFLDQRKSKIIEL